ncbi:hypothetical protein BpHYR1_012552 [Brachionus plicatilis]|uniref:Uncharacterized protein n=1 Tax=Brachionus plicatilis TaxID=10195 RepID=A0A3M7PIU3_BRAPC|nr:hypothetical protein BpHYR1_012552 [Brachionus plicatilis]
MKHKNIILFVNIKKLNFTKSARSFYKGIAMVPLESSYAAKLAAKKELSKQSNPVECSIWDEFMKNEKEAFLITKFVIIDH